MNQGHNTQSVTAIAEHSEEDAWHTFEMNFEVYKLMLEERHRIDTHTGNVLTRAQSICLVLLGGEAYLAATSTLTGWLPVVVTFGISLFGLAFLRTVRKQEAFDRLQMTACTDIGINTERALVAEGEGMLTALRRVRREQRQAAALKLKRAWIPKRVQSMQFLVNSRYLFIAAFIVVPLAFALVTYLALNPATHSLVQPLLSVK